MAVTKVHIISVFIGFLLRQVSGRPMERMSDKIEKTTDIYDLPKSLKADDTFDIKFLVQALRPFNISLIRKSNETACTLRVKDMDLSNMEISGHRDTIEEGLEMFVESKNSDGITIMVSFTVRENWNTSQTDIIQVGGGGQTISDFHFNEIEDIENIKYIKVTGYGMRVSEFKFDFKIK